MKRITILTISITILSIQAIAQQVKEVNLPKLNSKYTVQSQYLYDKFFEGTVFFEDNSETNSILNYNVLHDEIHYFGNNNVMELENEDISHIKLGPHVFIKWNKDYYEVLEGMNIKLLLKRVPELSVLSETTGAYGTSSVPASHQYSSVPRIDLSGQAANVQTINFRNNDDTEIPVYKRYYIQISEDEIIPAQKRKIIRAFKSNKRKVKTYLKENNIDLEKKEDLKKLISFLTEL